MDCRQAKICIETIDGNKCGWIYTTPICPRCAGVHSVAVIDLLKEFKKQTAKVDWNAARILAAEVADTSKE